MLLIGALALFILASFGGFFILSAILKNKLTPKPVVFIHGIVGGIGLLFLVTFVAVVKNTPLLITSLILFILAVVGGLVLFTFDITKKPIPKLLAIVHSMVALAAIVILVIFIFQLL